MISQIGIEEFRKRLKLNTSNGNPKITGTPFHVFNKMAGKNKLFYGMITQNNFKISYNKSSYPVPYIITGKMKHKNADQTEITYQITPIKFGVFWIRFLPIIFLFIFSTLLIVNKAPIEATLLPCLALVVMSIASNVLVNYKKKNFENSFKKIFEITDN